MKEQVFTLQNYKSFEPKHIFECGQCFRWNVNEDGSYTGIFGNNILNVKKEEVLDIIKYIKENNIKVGLAIKPKTSVEEIYEYLPYIHQVLIMTVEPGFGGQKLMPEMVEKVRTLKEYVEKNELDIDIEVDGRNKRK